MNIVYIDPGTGTHHCFKLVTQTSNTTDGAEDVILDMPRATNQERSVPTEAPLKQPVIEKPYACTVCGKAFAKSSYLTVHMRIHTGEKPYACELCSSRFSGQTALQRHTQRHFGIRSHKCETCGKTFVLKHQLREHEKVHTATEESPLKKYGCDLCNKAYRYPFQLKIHKRVHTGEKPVECPDCDCKFASNKIFADHYRRVHKKEKRHKCPFCERMFSDVGDCKRHIMIHTNEKPYKCDICGLDFRRNSYMQKHREKHSQDKDGKNSSKCSTLEKLFKCPMCERYFALELSRDMHYKFVHEQSTDEGCPSGTKTVDI